eukprot:PhM_4_TR5177/c0_g1_i1/m.27053
MSSNSTDERIVLKSSLVTVSSKDPTTHRWGFQLTPNTLVKCNVTVGQSITSAHYVLPIVWTVPLSYVHSVAPSLADPKLLTVRRFSSKTKKLKAHTYICDSVADRDEWVHCFRHTLVDYHQILFEQSFIASPRFYQYHTYVHTAGDKQQVAILVLDNQNWTLALVPEIGNLAAVKTVACGTFKDLADVIVSEADVSWSSQGAAFKVTCCDSGAGEILGTEMLRGKSLVVHG